MKIKKVIIWNFHKIKNLEVLFDNDGITLIIGENGAGKSTIFAAILWCLYGYTDRGSKLVGDSVINPDVGKDCKVAVFMELDNGSIMFERGVKCGPTKDNFIRILHSDGHEEYHNIGKKNRGDIVESINSILGCDYETFVRSYIIPQQGVIPFGYMTDAAMKDFFIDKFLNIRWLSDCFEVAKAKKNECERELNDLVNSISFVERTITNDEDDLHRFLAEFDKIEGERKENLKGLKLKKAGVEKKINETKKEMAKEEKKSKAKSGELKEITQEIETLTEEVGRKKEQYYDAKRALEGNNREKERIRLEMSDLQSTVERADKLVGQKCPTCGTLIVKKHVPFMIGEAENLINKKEKQIKAFLKKDVELSEIMKIANDQYNSLYEKQKELELRKEQFLIDQGSGNIAVLKTSFDRLQDDLETVKNDISLEQRKKNPYESSIERLRIRISESLDQIETHKEKSKEVEEKRNIYLFWMNAFSPQGIQTNILLNITPILNEVANFYLSTLSGGDLQCEFTTVSPLKSGKIVEKFSLIAYSLTGSLSYAGLSGGERKRVDISTALALADVKRSFSPKVLDILVLDEVFTGLDAEGITQTIDLLKNEFTGLPVYLITHQDVDRTQFERLWEVYKKDGVTQIGITGSSFGSIG